MIEKKKPSREETRSYVADFEMIHFSINDEPSFSIPMVITNKSKNGLGCFCVNNPKLSVGARLSNSDEAIYEVRWIEHLSNTVVNAGLKKLASRQRRAS
jgi:hypothetical protein